MDHRALKPSAVGTKGVKALGLLHVAAAAGRLKLLADTNFFVPLEPTKEADLEANTSLVFEVASLISKAGHSLFVHPEMRADLARDRDEARRAMRQRVVNKYPLLESPPSAESVERLLGPPAKPNDRVDNCMLAAVYVNAVDCLITDDIGIHRKARRLGLFERVLTTADALDFLRALHDVTPRPPPYVRATKAYALDLSDPIFRSFREDYSGFDGWLHRSAREHRHAWVIGAPGETLSAVAIVKREDGAIACIAGRLLKVCSFKVATEASGAKLGELLLKALLEHACENNYEGLFLTVFARHAVLLNLLQQFGFLRVDTKPNGELVLAKRLVPLAGHDGVHPLAYNILFGPRAVRSIAADPGFFVPIQPKYHDALFPDLAAQTTLSGPTPFGSAIRKAYLCHAPNSRLTPGSNLFFYRSGDQYVGCTGVLEGTLRSARPQEIAKYVGTRTVYPYAEIEQMCGRRPVLALLFRYSRALARPIALKEMLSESVLKGPPQSIVTANDDALRWLEARVRSHA